MNRTESRPISTAAAIAKNFSKNRTRPPDIENKFKNLKSFNRDFIALVENTTFFRLPLDKQKK
jgi:hypothetical protein